MDELSEIYLEASGGKYGDQNGIFAVRDHVIAEMKAKLDRAEHALKRAGYQDLGGQEWKPPLGLSVQAIRNAWLDAEVVGNSWDGAKAVLDLINKKEISTGKAFQMEPAEPGTMTQGEALEVVMAGVDQSASTKPVDLWSIITSITDIRVDCDGCDYVEIDRTSVSDLEVALRPWLRDPVGWELDVTWNEMSSVWAKHGSVKAGMEAVLDLCRKRVRPVYECDCSAIEKERDLLKVEYESRQIMINNVWAALEGRPFKNTLEGE